MVAQDPASSSSVMILSSTKPKNEVMVATRNKDYGNSNPPTIHYIDQCASSTSSISYPNTSFIPTELIIKLP